MHVADDLRDDVELRLVDPSKNRFRIYGLTECRTLFGELCLRIVWGRIGNRRLRERSETFADRAALARRRGELLGTRRRHGYVSTPAPPPAMTETSAPSQPRAVASVLATERAILEAHLEVHGMPTGDATARTLVACWHAATRAIVDYLGARGTEALDLVDASMLADMFVSASGATA